MVTVERSHGGTEGVNVPSNERIKTQKKRRSTRDSPSYGVFM